MEKKLSVLFDREGVSGKIELFNAGKADIEAFSLDGYRLDITVTDPALEAGAYATALTVRCDTPFTFFLRDVNAEWPIYIPEYGVAVTEATDRRDYAEIQRAIRSKGLKRRLDSFEERQESFASAAEKNRSMRAPMWMGISRDLRMFEVQPHGVVNDSALWDTIIPKMHHKRVRFPEMGDADVRFDYFAGRGIGTRYDVTRHLENRVLPILNVINEDGDISYRQKLFVTNEVSPLTAENLKGTNYLIADLYCELPTPRTPAQQEITDRIHKSEVNRDEETVMYLKIEAVNTAKAPRYAFVRTPQLNVAAITESRRWPVEFKEGLNYFTETGRVFMTSTLGGKPYSQVDGSLLLMPGEKAEFVFKIPHTPISKERARALMATDFEEKLAECTAFWQKKLEGIAQISLPEKRIEEMMKAGFLHLDLVCFGNEPEDAVAPVVGIYTPIGTESLPMIQYIESMGATSLAGRAAMYFAKKQREDGFMQNFQSYMSETGCGLWTLAQHFKYTRDIKWLEGIKDNLIRGCNYLMKWADESRDESLRGRGYGMIYGKIADCEDHFHNYMLNATTYGGVKACAEVLAYVDEKEAARIGAFAEELKGNIIESLKESFAVGPAVPLSDGSWCPTVSIWPELNVLGLHTLFTFGRNCYTHGAFTMKDHNMGGGGYMVMNGVLEADSLYMKFITNAMADMLFCDNVSYSQPYYATHPYVNLKQGRVGAFLSEFYNNMSALADRETYTFWEHLYQVSPHKTHEEGWFLMRCRWMLYMDEFGSLDILPGVPSAWLEEGSEIAFSGMASRYGRLSLKVKAQRDKIRAEIGLEPNGERLPDSITIRLPHPEGKRATSCAGGRYNPETEQVIIDGFTQKAEIVLEY